MPLPASQLEQALRATGVHLDALGIEAVVRLYLVGGSAGLPSGLLPAARTTGDVDVSAVDPADCWEHLDPDASFEDSRAILQALRGDA